MSQTIDGPLSGVRVIELAHIMAGPACGLLLADLGADVVKVEKVPGGDASRDMVPPTIDGESAAFLMLNRNKRGIAVDLKTEKGRALVRDLLVEADVVIENYRAGTMQRFGLGYDALRGLNPRLIYCAISGFGRTGPLGSHSGFDLIAQGLSGLMSITGEGPNRPPVKCGAPITDITAGILGAVGILAALVDRARTGKGQLVETSLFEAGITQTFWQSAIYLATGVSPGPLGSAHPLSAPYQSFETADGWINVGASSEASWQRVPAAVDLPELLNDPRFRTNADRMANLDELVEILVPVMRTRTTRQWLERFEAGGVPAGPVLTVGQMLAHEQTRARAMVQDVNHTKLGSTQTLGCPVKLERGARSDPRAAPVFGEHTTEILLELGLSKTVIEGLHREGVIHSEQTEREE